jgi:hypothetical protein
MVLLSKPGAYRGRHHCPSTVPGAESTLIQSDLGRRDTAALGGGSIRGVDDAQCPEVVLPARLRLTAGRDSLHQ